VRKKKDRAQTSIKDRMKQRKKERRKERKKKRKRIDHHYTSVEERVIY
jgi:hypothetical protein